MNKKLEDRIINGFPLDSHLINKEKINIKIPEKVSSILKSLQDNGYEAYVVGGCVRDSLLGVIPSDWDITTSALPGDIKRIFNKTVDTGLKHGTVTVLINKEPFEVTTYRIDGEYEDNRRPKEVEFTSDIGLDLKRRDFTINAMAYSEKNGIVDLFNGISDLNNRVIKCVGDANERFAEDALRMLRAIRFSAQLGFEIHKETERAIKENAELINNVSAERIKVEITKTLTSNNPVKIEVLYSLGLMEYVMPEFIPCIDLKQNNPYHIYDVDKHIYTSLLNIEAEESLRWTMYLHDIGKGYTRTTDDKGIDHFHGHVKVSLKHSKTILNRLKFDNKTKDKILKLIEYHDYRIEDNIKSVRKAINKVGQELFEDYIKVQKADVLSQNPEFLDERIDKLNHILDIYKKIIAEGQCTTLKELAITGSDLIDIGYKQGTVIGKTLNKLLSFVLDDPSRNNKKWLLEKAKQLNN